MRRIISKAAVIGLVLGALGVGGASAAQAKVAICHLGDDGYELISASEKSVPKHRAHGDGLPGEPVPGQSGKVFGEDCSVDDAPLSGYEVVTTSAMSFGDGGYGGWSCPSGKVVIGGGFTATEPVAVSTAATPSSVWPHYTFGASESGWVVRDALDGVGNTITISVICADPVAGYEVVTSPSMSFGDGGYGGWSCPAGKIVLGGGFNAIDTVAVSTPGTPGAVWPHYTFGGSEHGWVVSDDSNGAGNTIAISAVCSAPVAGYAVVTSSAMAFGDGGFGGWSCPTGTSATGGGFTGTDPVAVSAPGTPGAVWPHYTFGTGEYGWVVSDDSNGGGNTIAVSAICATS